MRLITKKLLLLIALSVVWFLPASPTQAAKYCFKITGVFVDCAEQGEPKCSESDGCKADPASLDYCVTQTTSQSCVAIKDNPGCCYCEADPIKGILSASLEQCQGQCAGKKYKWNQGESCDEFHAKEAAEYFKKQPAAAAPAAAAPAAQKAITLKNPLGTASVPVLVGRIIRVLLGLSGSLALLMFIYGGFTWITSGGIPDRIAKGKNTMVWAALGLALIFGAYSLLAYLLSKLTGAT